MPGRKALFPLQYPHGGSFAFPWICTRHKHVPPVIRCPSSPLLHAAGGGGRPAPSPPGITAGRRRGWADSTPIPVTGQRCRPAVRPHTVDTLSVSRERRVSGRLPSPAVSGMTRAARADSLAALSRGRQHLKGCRPRRKGVSCRLSSPASFYAGASF